MLVCTQQLSRFLLTMATIKINPSTVTCTEKVAAQLCSILAENGIQFSFTPGSYKVANDKKDILISQMQMSVRAARAIRMACESTEIDYNNIYISDFLEAFNKKSLCKFRNISKRTLGEIESALADNGFLLE